MENLTTFKSTEFHSSMYSMYFSLCELMKNTALLHVNTRETNNPYHFKHALDEANKTINKFASFYPLYDKRREDFKELDEEDLIREANEFFKEDFY